VARLVLDDVFGEEYFQSEIIWSYRRWSNSARRLLPAHQTILFYSKGKDPKFNTILTAYSPTTNVDQILQRRSRDESNKSVYARGEDSEVIYAGAKRGVPLSDVWDIPFLNPKAKERTGYPTQKPILLLERIIQISTDEGDLVVDPFCGSGTALIAATLLGRSAIGIDISSEAVDLTRRRLSEPVRTDSNLLRDGIESYQNADNEALSVLNGIPHTPVQRNRGIDAFLDQTFQNVPIPVRIQRRGETLGEAGSALYKAAKSKNAGCMIMIAIDDQPSLFDTQLPEEVIVVSSVEFSIKKILRRLSDGKASGNGWDASVG
jgi:site-specific DNA-methyltransferase (adenine-specific)